MLLAYICCVAIGMCCMCFVAMSCERLHFPSLSLVFIRQFTDLGFALWPKSFEKALHTLWWFPAPPHR